MAKIVESVPNISEGKNKQIIEACVDQIRMAAGCTLLQYSSDPNHNRTVITYMGSLAAVRKGQFEGMTEKVKDPLWLPDFGGQRIHPTGGIVAVGARPPLVAFNINLNTSDVEIVNKIAKIIRKAGGGLDNVKAMGVLLEDRNIAQVSINMTDFNRTPLYRVVELTKVEAARYGLTVIGTELIGLCPMKALFDSAEYYLQIEDFDAQVQVIENHLL